MDPEAEELDWLAAEAAAEAAYESAAENGDWYWNDDCN